MGKIPKRKQVPFELCSDFEPMGDQPQAIAQINENLNAKIPFQVLLGVTGSGKTFTIAQVIAKQNRPCLVLAPNKTLAAQLYTEFRELFPKNQVRYFVSYYDYYQPEAFIPSTNTYIEKDAAINDEIDKMRHAATKSLLESRDTIIVASISCIYGIGAPEKYFEMMLFIEVGQTISREELIQNLVRLQFVRADEDFRRGSFRVKGEVVDIFPSDEDARAIRIIFFGDEIEEIREIDSITSTTLQKTSSAAIYPTSHYVTDQEALERARKTIKKELKVRLAELRNAGKVLEADRLEQRTLYDLELMKELGFCSGIENYSRHITERDEGQPPPTLLDYFPKDFILVIDESHVTVSQLGAMYRGDRSRKESLVEHGFRLPSAFDNRPLNNSEFWQRVNQAIFVSATPGEFELEKSAGIVVEQVIRPTGLLDPEVIIRPATNQVDDLLAEIQAVVKNSERVLITTLTKKMAEDLSGYLRRIGVKSRYLHSDIDTIERMEILRGLRRGDFDVLIGINLLREGLDLPEVSLVAILDADKEGFLRSTRSLIQTIGRAARNIKGRAILYADRVTDSIQNALDETMRRREKQELYNKVNSINPRSIIKELPAALIDGFDDDIDRALVAGQEILIPSDPVGQRKLVEELRSKMHSHASRKEFEQAAQIRDALNAVQEKLLR